MARTFDDSWKIWIWHNVSRGCGKDGIFRILHDKGFDFDAIAEELGHVPTLPLDQIENPRAVDSRALVAESSSVFIPNAERLESSRVELYTLEEFLDEGECEHLISLTRGSLRPSTITNENEPDPNFRTSKTADLSLMGDAVVDEIDRRICRLLGINPSHSEGIQGQFYEPGNEFKEHTDWFEPDSEDFARFGAERGQRTWTAMVYLNDVDEGGGTHFTNLGEVVHPRRGRALIWNNLYPGGAPNPDTLHRAAPVADGFKAVITKWFRQNGAGATWTREDGENIPNLTRTGFARSRIPDAVLRGVNDFYEAEAGDAQEEDVPGDYLERSDGVPSEMLELPAALKEIIAESLRAECERWCGESLEVTSVYGIRRYLRGASLVMHRDRERTHIVSAILNIDQNVDREWPLEIEDNYYRRHSIVLSPGDMLLYEGARLAHGRPTPLEGEYFCNVFVHYRPVGYGLSQSTPSQREQSSVM